MFIDGARFSSRAYECKAESSSRHLGILIRKLHTASDHKSNLPSLHFERDNRNSTSEKRKKKAEAIGQLDALYQIIKTCQK